MATAIGYDNGNGYWLLAMATTIGYGYGKNAVASYG